MSYYVHLIALLPALYISVAFLTNYISASLCSSASLSWRRSPESTEQAPVHCKWMDTVSCNSQLDLESATPRLARRSYPEFDAYYHLICVLYEMATMRSLLDTHNILLVHLKLCWLIPWHCILCELYSICEHNFLKCSLILNPKEIKCCTTNLIWLFKTWTDEQVCHPESIRLSNAMLSVVHTCGTVNPSSPLVGSSSMQVHTSLFAAAIFLGVHSQVKFPWSR